MSDESVEVYVVFMNARSLSGLVFVVAILSSCAVQRLPNSPASTQFRPKAENGPYTVIGYLEHRDRVVTIKSGEQGIVYSVQNRKDGKYLYENLTAEQLKTQSPEIHDFIEAATAASAGMSPAQISIK